jgi:hypothetical protein
MKARKKERKRICLDGKESRNSMEILPEILLFSEKTAISSRFRGKWKEI